MVDFVDNGSRRSSADCEAMSSSSTAYGEEEPKTMDTEEDDEHSSLMNHPTGYISRFSLYKSAVMAAIREEIAWTQAHSAGRRFRKSICIALTVISILAICLFYSSRDTSQAIRPEIQQAKVPPLELGNQSPPTQSSTESSPEKPLLDSTPTKPKDVKIIALIPSGRRDNLEILDCYLQKNLVKNGGWLDEVLFAINTDNADDLAWIDRAVATNDEYKSRELGISGIAFDTYYNMYNKTVEPGHIYLKIDDDTVWIDDNAIQESVSTLLAHPEAFLISANLINGVEQAWLHLHSGAIHPYLPEPTEPKNAPPASYGPFAWRPSELPTYDGALELNGTLLPGFAKDNGYEEVFFEEMTSPYPHHRWLPLRDPSLLPLTPIFHAQYAKYAPQFSHWQHAAQQHYSLLQNIEASELWRYDFGGRDGLWNTRYDHANINFITFRGDDLIKALEMLPLPEGWNDEWHFTMNAPRVLRKQVYVATRALASHFSQALQGVGIAETDLLGRYRALANERVCRRERRILGIFNG